MLQRRLFIEVAYKKLFLKGDTLYFVISEERIAFFPFIVSKFSFLSAPLCSHRFSPLLVERLKTKEDVLAPVHPPI